MADDSDVSEITISDDEQTAQGTKAAAAAAAVARVRSLKQQKQQQQQRAAQAQQGYEEGEEDGEAAAGPSTSGGGKGKSGRRGGREGKGRARFADEVEVFGGGEVGYVNGWHEPAGDEGARDDGREDGAVEDESKPLGWSYFRKRDTSEGPVTWEEVDVGELKFVAENLVHSTTQKAASQAGEVMQQIFQAAPGAGDEAAVSDPLGRGYLNLDSMTLVRRALACYAASPRGGARAAMWLRAWRCRVLRCAWARADGCCLSARLWVISFLTGSRMQLPKGWVVQFSCAMEAFGETSSQWKQGPFCMYAWEHSRPRGTVTHLAWRQLPASRSHCAPYRARSLAAPRCKRRAPARKASKRYVNGRPAGKPVSFIMAF